MDQTSEKNKTEIVGHALFYYESCYFCRKVLNFLEKNNLSLELKNIRTSEENYQELINLNHSSQVPCLLINGEPMLESDDIIDYLKKNFVKN